MKKTLSLMLAIMLVLPLAMTSFADTQNIISLGKDTNSGITLNNSILTPGEEYRFPINIAMDTKTLTDEVLKDFNFKISNTGTGKSLKTINLVKISGVHYLNVAVKDGYPAKQTEEEYTLKLVSKSNGKTIGELESEFKTGYNIVDDAVIDALGMEDQITIDNNAPVYAPEQLERISKVNNYKKVAFTDGEWTFNVNVTDTPAINMMYNNRANSSLLSQYPNNSFEFINFPGTPTFKTSGTLEIDVTDLSEDFMQKFYVYRIENDKILKVAASYNHEDDMLTINTNTLGHFVITDREINKSTVVTPPSSGGNGSNDTDPPHNPNTGVAV